MNFAANDCSPLETQPKPGQDEWLRELVAATREGEHVISIAGERDPDDPIVSCAPDGRWWAGRYVGTLAMGKHRLTIAPRFGIEVLKAWLAAAINVSLVETVGKLDDDESFIVQLLALVWGRGLAEAARHGLPALRQDVRHVGAVVRGRLDVAASLRSMAAGQPKLVSVRREKSVNHAGSRAIVAAYAALRGWLDGREDAWIPERARDLLVHLTAAMGSRPPVPTKVELARVRYTPITAGFAPVAELSRQIANRRGLASNHAPDGTCQGVLLDVAELWELYVLAVLRRAAAGLVVQHGTREIDALGVLLRSEVDDSELGRLRPDALVTADGGVVAVVDAKYKRLHPTPIAPSGPQREDLYQLAAYLSRFGDLSSCAGVLVYPRDPTQPTEPPAEARSPWRLGDSQVWFVTIPHAIGDAVTKLSTLSGLSARLAVTNHAEANYRSAIRSSRVFK